MRRTGLDMLRDAAEVLDGPMVRTGDEQARNTIVGHMRRCSALAREIRAYLNVVDGGGEG